MNAWAAAGCKLEPAEAAVVAMASATARATEEVVVVVVVVVVIIAIVRDAQLFIVCYYLRLPQWHGWRSANVEP